MASDFGDDGLTRLGVAGALCREYAADEHAFLGFLASSLERAFGPDVQIMVKGGFLSKKVVRGVTLTSSEGRYTLEDQGNGTLNATFSRVVRGIALKTETMKVEEWLAAISEIAEQKASQHAATRKALEDVLGLS